jgi:hypothetical protein
VLWTAWLTGYVLRNYRPPGECSFAEPDPMVLNQSLRTILTEFSDAHVCLENLDILLPVVADGFATIDKTITLGRNAI